MLDLHLHALSILLNVPIYVKEQKGVKGHDLQMFNPTESAERTYSSLSRGRST